MLRWPREQLVFCRQKVDRESLPFSARDAHPQAMADEYGAMKSDGETHVEAEFALEDGTVLKDVETRYNTWGTLNAKKDKDRKSFPRPQLSQYHGAMGLLARHTGEWKLGKGMRACPYAGVAGRPTPTTESVVAKMIEENHTTTTTGVDTISVLAKLIRHGKHTPDEAESVSDVLPQLVQNLDEAQLLPPTRDSEEWGNDASLYNAAHAMLRRFKPGRTRFVLKYPMPLYTLFGPKHNIERTLLQPIRAARKMGLACAVGIPVCVRSNHWVTVVVSACNAHPKGCAAFRDTWGKYGSSSKVFKTAKQKFAQVGVVCVSHDAKYQGDAYLCAW